MTWSLLEVWLCQRGGLQWRSTSRKRSSPGSFGQALAVPGPPQNVDPFGRINSHSRAELFCDTAFAPIPLFEATCFVQSGRNRRAAVRQHCWSGREPMSTKWLLIFLLVTFANTRDVVAQVGDLAGVLPGDRWVYEVKDEITGDLKRTTTVVVLDVSEKEINTRMSVRGAARPFRDRVRPQLEPHRRRHLEVQTVRRRGRPNPSSGRQGVALREQVHARERHCAEHHGPVQGGRRGKGNHERRHLRHVQDRDQNASRQCQRPDQGVDRERYPLVRANCQSLGAQNKRDAASRVACATCTRRSLSIIPENRSAGRHGAGAPSWHATWALVFRR